MLKQVFKDFPEGTVHMIAIDPITNQSERLVAMRLDSHFFVGSDSGIYSLISSLTPDEVVEISSEAMTFPARYHLAEIAAEIAKGTSLVSLGQPIENLVTKVDRHVRMTKREIAGQVIHIDHFGNLISNIEKSQFEKIQELNGSGIPFRVRFAREEFTSFHSHYSDVEGGDCFVIFNSYGYLEIGINKGRAADLLGLRLDAPVLIEFGS